MKFSQSPENTIKFYLAHDISQLPIGTRFFKNPPHVTLTPPAYIQTEHMPSVQEFLLKLSEQADTIALESMGFMFVGHRSTPTPATRFEKTPAIKDLHERLVKGLGDLGCNFVSLEYALENYNPHSEALLVDEGEILTMNNMTTYTKRPHPNISGLTEITDRYHLSSPSSD